MPPFVSVVVPTRAEPENLWRTVSAIRAVTDYPEYEILVVYEDPEDCASIEGMDVRLIDGHGLGPGLSRNLGAEKARGDVLCFVDSNVVPISADWLARLATLAESEGGMWGPTVAVCGNRQVKAHWLTLEPDLTCRWLNVPTTEPTDGLIVAALCMAVRKDEFWEIGAFNKNFRSWGFEDTELCLRAWLLGHKVRVFPGIEVEHIFKDKFSYPRTWYDIDRNALRMAFALFKKERIVRVVRSLRALRDITPALDSVINSDVWEERAEMLRRRVFDDDWLFKKFGVGF